MSINNVSSSPATTSNAVSNSTTDVKGTHKGHHHHKAKATTPAATTPAATPTSTTGSSAVNGTSSNLNVTA